ncbi:Uma2 family endonuclease [Actinophytocola gossypii]|uniref:Uma2 family endonuclease n=1 Tax=Actinophytocola gossypii TaxID=2812003 RepID=UPI0021A7703B|nr:Uma2 family endonuclease [Actinophytocola gossypii]
MTSGHRHVPGRSGSTGPVTLDHYIGPNTVDDWFARDHPTDGSRLELVYGHLHTSPPPSGQHQYAVDELRLVLKHALRDAGRSDLYAVSGVGVRISTGWRTALIPDVAVLNTRPGGTSIGPDDLELVVEIWSPGHARRPGDHHRRLHGRGRAVPLDGRPRPPRQHREHARP